LKRRDGVFFPRDGLPANVRLEPSVTIRSTDLDALGEDFEKASKGFVDFLLLDSNGFPLIVLEAKSEDKNPLFGKEQARKYARSLNCRFVMLSNGNLHYFWDLDRGNPYIVLTQRPNYKSEAAWINGGGASRLHPGQQTALPSGLPVECDQGAATSGQG